MQKQVRENTEENFVLTVVPQGNITMGKLIPQGNLLENQHIYFSRKEELISQG